jgi:hypothetical protein
MLLHDLVAKPALRNIFAILSRRALRRPSSSPSVVGCWATTAYLTTFASRVPIATEKLSKMGGTGGIIQHKEQSRDTYTTHQLRETGCQLIATHRDQGKIKFIGGADPPDDVHLRTPSTVVDNVFECQAVPRNGCEALTARDDSDVVSGYRELGSIKRADDPGAKNQNFHGYVVLATKPELLLPSTRLPLTERV